MRHPAQPIVPSAHTVVRTASSEQADAARQQLTGQLHDHDEVSVMTLCGGGMRLQRGRVLRMTHVDGNTEYLVRLEESGEEEHFMREVLRKEP